MNGISVRELIDQRARQTPEAVYLVDPQTGRTVSYLELKNAAASVASRIADAGVQPGGSVAYAMANGVDTALVILGILYGGYLATAINLVAGNKIISYVIDHSEAELIFSQTDILPVLTQSLPDMSRIDVIEVDAGLFATGDDNDKNDDNHNETKDGTGSDTKNNRAADTGPTADSRGLLMYTSGTTGVPKGVLLNHGNLIAGGKNTVSAHGLDETDRGLCVLPLYHINGLCVSVMGSLVSGGSLIVPQKFSVSRFWDLLRTCQGSWFSVVPTQISYLLMEADTSGAPEKNNRLRFGRSASAPLAPDVHKQFEERFGVPIVETMGLTETAAPILSNPLPPGKRKSGSPGVAVGNEIRIADTSQNELPRGEVGEILVRGPNVMCGYLKNPQATSDSLTKDGWLRTGDLGRMDEEDYVFVTGRLKELIIKGGENIAPREIDDALYSHPDVVEAAAFARPCSRYGQEVEAGVMLKAGSALTEGDLIRICQDQVGAFKTPHRIHFFPELPKGPSGKIQRLKVAELTQQTAKT